LTSFFFVKLLFHLKIYSPQSNKTQNAPVIPAGQLTAGEWKDLDHWSFWSKLMENGEFKRMQDHWKYYPRDRFAVKLSDENGRAIANTKIELLNQKMEVVWEARSDNRGSAELWGNFYGGDGHDFQISNVESLNDLFIRLISENASYYDCSKLASASEIIPKSKLTKKVRKRKKEK